MLSGAADLALPLKVSSFHQRDKLHDLREPASSMISIDLLQNVHTLLECFPTTATNFCCSFIFYKILKKCIWIMPRRAQHSARFCLHWDVAKSWEHVKVKVCDRKKLCKLQYPARGRLLTGQQQKTHQKNQDHQINDWQELQCKPRVLQFPFLITKPHA